MVSKLREEVKKIFVAADNVFEGVQCGVSLVDFRGRQVKRELSGNCIFGTCSNNADRWFRYNKPYIGSGACFVHIYKQRVLTDFVVPKMVRNSRCVGLKAIVSCVQWVRGKPICVTYLCVLQPYFTDIAVQNNGGLPFGCGFWGRSIVFFWWSVDSPY